MNKKEGYWKWMYGNLKKLLTYCFSSEQLVLRNTLSIYLIFMLLVVSSVIIFGEETVNEYSIWGMLVIPIDILVVTYSMYKETKNPGVLE